MFCAQIIILQHSNFVLFFYNYTDDNALGNEGMKEICEGLEGNKTLTTLIASITISF